jgi:hypothetical protein
MTHLLISTALDTARMLVMLTVLATPPVLYRRTRHVLVTMARLTIRKSPRWLAPALAVCAFIPGPVDELLVLVLATVPILRSARNRALFARTARYAWKV